MPWRTSTVETARARFVMEANLSDLSHAELCRRHGISRPTGYEWIERYRSEGLSGLESPSHAARSCPHVTQAGTVERILQIRDKPGWGARKIWKKLVDDPQIEPVPCVDTVHQVLVRYGRVEPKKPRRRRTHPGPPLPIEPEPNATWTADFKGELRTTHGRLCYPQTIQAGRIQPGEPQQNGRHERMHRTLKKRTANPPRATLRAQQTRFNDFRRVHNTERPHEALDLETHASIYEPSPRPFVERPGSLTYPGRRIVSGDSTLRWKCRKVFVSSLLKYHTVGLAAYTCPAARWGRRFRVIGFAVAQGRPGGRS